MNDPYKEERSGLGVGERRYAQAEAPLVYDRTHPDSAYYRGHLTRTDGYVSTQKP